MIVIFTNFIIVMIIRIARFSVMISHGYVTDPPIHVNALSNIRAKTNAVVVVDPVLETRFSIECKPNCFLLITSEPLIM